MAASHRRITMVDVAARAGVSHSTVSRVLSGGHNVHPDTHQVVLAAVRELGYTVNHGARTLAGGRSSVVGVVVYDFASPYVSEFLQAMENTLTNAGLSMLVGSAHGSPDDPQRHIARITQHNVCDGLILLFPGYYRYFIDEFNRQTLPFVFIDEPESAIADTVYVDNEGGTRTAIKHLVDLGHQRIGFIGGYIRTAAGAHRLEAYKAAVREFGISSDPDLMVGGDFREPGGFAGADQLLSLDDPPTAIFAGSDGSALGAISACQAHRRRVPEDVSVIGFDDLGIAATARPPLTTIRQPLSQVADRALEALERRIVNPTHAFEQIRIGTKLIVRESTGPAPANST